jgi:histidinol phosphatase-like enzyme (inositol monophosphatase family)
VPPGSVGGVDVAGTVDHALAAVQEAGETAVRHFRTRLAVADKAPGSVFDPVTEADRAVEALIRERLHARFPDHRIVGEEHGETGSGRVTWVVDPIDGTRAFISGMPTWGILLGLVVDAVPVAGIVHQPYTHETWIADPERGARLLRPGQAPTPLATRAEARLEDAILYSTHPSLLAADGVLAGYEALAARCRLQRWGGDCYAFALVAQGFIDLMVDGCLKPYDIVPLIPIIERAGGVVTDLDGRTPLAGGTVVAAASRALHGQAMAALRGS